MLAYPKVVAKEAVTVSPMDKPECVKAFIRASFSPSGTTTQYPAPVLTPDISGGTAWNSCSSNSSDPFNFL